MEQMLINAAGTLAFGGGTCAIITYFAFKYGQLQLENSKAELQRVCDSFDRALDRRDKDIDLLIAEIRSYKLTEQRV